MRDAQPLAHFETLYAASDDPWDVRGAWYEQRKRGILLASLGKPRYRSAFEPGCGNGEMSIALAARCERLLACDGAASALEAARRRVPDAASRGIRFEARRLPTDWPRAETFDLIVLSELAYYFDEAALAAMLASATANLAPDGELVLCHYLHDFDDRITPTMTVHALADALPGLRRALHHRDEAFVLDVWRPVASSEGEHA
ncbi:SAM-dependent methyltransferase [Massilia sp. MP_M2]|uniref:SAM-dependent methyltransferase n=1 Tax=Massilia sp. MP_M2 TaxID=3071713 RepID=UPI00319DB957